MLEKGKKENKIIKFLKEIKNFGLKKVKSKIKSKDHNTLVRQAYRRLELKLKKGLKY